MNPSMIQAIMNLQQNLQNQNGSNVTRTDSNGLPSSVSPHQQTGGIPSMTPSTDQEGLRGLDIQGMMGRMLQDTEVLRQMESILGNTQGQQNSQLETMMSQILNTSQVSPGTNETSIPPATRYQCIYSHGNILCFSLLKGFKHNFNNWRIWDLLIKIPIC
jgi:hypothetical protein